MAALKANNCKKKLKSVPKWSQASSAAVSGVQPCKAGLTEGQILDLANVFGYDIDFALDIHSGDTFSVMFERNYAEGQYIGNGAILGGAIPEPGPGVSGRSSHRW